MRARRGGETSGVAWVALVLSSTVARAQAPTASYEVTPTADLGVLEVEATFAAGAGPRFVVDAGVADQVMALELLDPSGAVARQGEGWLLAPCERARCRVRYRFALGRAAAERDDVDLAARQGASIVAPPSTWLLRPTGDVVYELHVRSPAGTSFLVGLRPKGANDGTGYAGTFGPMVSEPYALFGRFRVMPLEAGAARVSFAVPPALERDAPAIRAWAQRAVRAVSAYYGRFPVADALVAAVEKGRGVFGKEMGGGSGASVLLEVAPGADLADPASEWIATHELVHLAVPNMARAHTWLTEGLATYVEPVARAQSGDVPASRVWRDAVAGMPNGLPAAGDRGLDRTPTWGRTYWGGALFFLVADVEITRATAGRQSLQSALRGALAAGADTTVDWTPERFFTAADRAIGRPILTEQYRRWATTPVPIDLDELWKNLGVVAAPGGPRFDDGAPWAWVRDSITRARPAAPSRARAR